MNTKEKKHFLRELISNVVTDIMNAADKMPDTWDGHELRRYIADKFEEATITLKPGTKDAGYRRRLREYQAIRIERNL